MVQELIHNGRSFNWSVPACPKCGANWSTYQGYPGSVYADCNGCGVAWPAFKTEAEAIAHYVTGAKAITDEELVRELSAPPSGVTVATDPTAPQDHSYIKHNPHRDVAKAMKKLRIEFPI